MAKEIKIGNPSDFDLKHTEICDFYEKNWNRPTCLSNSIFYQWQFCDVPYATVNGDCCIAVCDDKIIAVMGVNSRRFWNGSLYLNGAELTTWIVHKDYQNQGVGPKILGYLQSKYQILLGLGITDAALSVYMRLGFRYKRAIPRFVKVIDWLAVDKKIGIQSSAKKIDNFWKKNIKYEDYVCLEFDEENFNKIYSEHQSNCFFYERSFDLIEWRYLKHPFFKYNLKFVANKEESNEINFVAYRIDKTASGLNIMHVTDLFGSQKSTRSTLKFLEDTAANNSIHVIDFYTTNIKQHGDFLRYGWFSTLDDHFFKFPHLFHPLEFREPSTTSMVIWAENESNIYDDFSKIYITKQDADFDRPALINTI